MIDSIRTLHQDTPNLLISRDVGAGVCLVANDNRRKCFRRKNLARSFECLNGYILIAWIAEPIWVDNWIDRSVDTPDCDITSTEWRH